MKQYIHAWKQQLSIIILVTFLYNSCHYHTINPKIWWFTDIKVGQIWTYTQENPNPFQSYHQDTIFVTEVRNDFCKGRYVNWYGKEKVYDEFKVFHKDDLLSKYILKK